MKRIASTGDLAGRAIPEWIGKTADTKIPDRVRLRICLRQSRKDALTGAPLVEGWHVDHIVPLKDWIATPEYPHGNVESNMQAVNANENTAKAAVENKARKKVSDIQKKHMGIEAPKVKIQSRPFHTRLKPPKGSGFSPQHKAHLEAMARKDGRA